MNDLSTTAPRGDLLSNDLEGFYRDRRVLVTGGVGSVGRELVHQLLDLQPACLRVIDNNESGLFQLEQSVGNAGPLECFHCDVTHRDELQRLFAGIDICVHAAALKHVPSCEKSPFSTVAVNVNGVENIAKAALAAGVGTVLFTSSDKAVNPTNVMGTSKLLGERLFTAMNALAGEGSGGPVFASTRFGNVAGSNGSVIPLFLEQIRQGGPVTLTDERMTRFIMSVSDAVTLVLRSAMLARGGEIFVTRMPVVRIADLARVMIEELAPRHGHAPESIEISIVGPRPGEKLWEELSTDEERRRIYQSRDFLVVFPAMSTDMRARAAEYEELELEPVDRVYHSDRETPMDDAAIRAFLARPGVLPTTLSPMVPA